MSSADPQPGVAPVLSVVVVIVSDTTAARCDTTHLAGCLQALAEQQAAPPFEIIVPHHLQVDGIAELREQFPDVRFLPVADLRTFDGLGKGNREHHDELRARGLRAASGSIVGLLEDHARPDPHWCRQVVIEHQQDYAAVGGAIENGIDRPLNWAVYYCDFGKYQNPLPAGESGYASDANVSYKTAALEAVRPSWEEVFQEPRVNAALLARGEKIALSPRIIVNQHRSGLGLRGALAERYVWGRSYAASRSSALGSKRLVLALLSPVLPFILLARMAANVRRKGRTAGAFVRALPLTALLLVGWSCGEFAGYLGARPAAGQAGALAGDLVGLG